MPRKGNRQQKRQSGQLLDEPELASSQRNAEAAYPAADPFGAWIEDIPPDEMQEDHTETTNSQPTAATMDELREHLAASTSQSTQQNSNRRSFLNGLASKPLSGDVDMSVLEALCVMIAFSYKNGIPQTEHSRKSLFDMVEAFMPQANLPSFSEAEKVRVLERAPIKQ